MSVVALVPARGGSKGLAGKNLAHVAGRSLVRRAVEVARAVTLVDEVVVSSDDEEILAEGRAAGATALRRPDELATDDAPSESVVRHLLDHRPRATVMVLVQPTSPLRDVADVRACLEALGGAPAAVTVTAVDHPVEWLFHLGEGGGLEPILGWDRLVARRQDAIPVYALNGAVYAARTEHLRNGGRLVGPATIAVPMPSERSVDVDDGIGLALARLLAERTPQVWQ